MIDLIKSASPFLPSVSRISKLFSTYVQNEFDHRCRFGATCHGIYGRNGCIINKYKSNDFKSVPVCFEKYRQLYVVH